MSPQEPERLPTLTEVVGAPPAPVAADEATPHGETGDDALAQRVLEAVQRRIDLALEYRLRETLGPALARLTDALVGDMRVELAATLRTLVAEALEQERQRRARHGG